MSEERLGYKKKRVSWLVFVAFAAPLVLMFVLAGYRTWAWHHPRPERAGELHDPTDMVPDYIALIERWRSLPFVEIKSLSRTNLMQISGFAKAELSPVQKDVLLTKVDDLIKAHQTGDSVALQRVMLPFDKEDGVEFTPWGTDRTSIILKAAKGENGMSAAQDRSPWSVTEAAWKSMVVKWELTNWWRAVSLDNSRVIVIKAESTNQVADVASTNYYGEFASTVSVPSSFLYPEFNNYHHDSTQAEIVIVGVRLLVQIHNHEKKPIPYVFRWRWSAVRSTWYPYDYCVGSAAGDGPQPFF